ncbi:hypothetical protein BB560_004800, partial [Smittium megazygosporum]
DAVESICRQLFDLRMTMQHDRPSKYTYYIVKDEQAAERLLNGPLFYEGKKIEFFQTVHYEEEVMIITIPSFKDVQGETLFKAACKTLSKYGTVKDASARFVRGTSTMVPFGMKILFAKNSEKDMPNFIKVKKSRVGMFWRGCTPSCNYCKKEISDVELKSANVDTNKSESAKDIEIESKEIESHLYSRQKVKYETITTMTKGPNCKVGFTPQLATYLKEKSLAAVSNANGAALTAVDTEFAVVDTADTAGVETPDFLISSSPSPNVGNMWLQLNEIHDQTYTTIYPIDQSVRKSVFNKEITMGLGVIGDPFPDFSDGIDENLT